MEYRIYLITNLITGQQYIGQTNQTIQERFNNHCRESLRKESNCYLHNAIYKYGPENFSLELIEDNITEDQIDSKEIYYIEKYKTFFEDGDGYNMTRGGQGVHGYKHSDSSKQKISESIKGKWDQLKLDQDSYNKFCSDRGLKHRGWKPSEETLQKMSQSASNRVGELNSFYGKHHSEKTKQAISEAQSVPIQMVGLDGQVLLDFDSCKQAAEYIYQNCQVKASSPSTISSRITKVVRGEAKTAYGYIWRMKCID